MGPDEQWYEWDVSAYLRGREGQSVSFVLTDQGQDNRTIRFSSKEGDNPPELKILDNSGNAAPNPSSSDSVSIVNSNSANRTNASNLNGKTVDDNIYVQVSPDNDVDRVQFFIDDKLISTENFAPFDLRGGSNGGANPFDTNDLSNGQHTLSAEILFNNGSNESISASFEVNN